MFDAFVIEIDLHDIHEMGHLSEYQNSMVKLFQFGEYSIY